MDIFRTTEEWEQEIGQQLRRLRLLRNIDQRTLAQRANVAVNAIKNLEHGKGATLKSLIRVLKVLDRVEWLNALQPEISISPLDMVKRMYRKSMQRQRASGNRRRK